ncbi:hypothetical protein KIL84_015547 [Mauremys mutica]|uniref:Uncharacterized protein n=1 Tax=Mauremys mutica TaxID=74926 RepID=A0A9D3WTB8_9SAUR|nr:hypothetical protein KIL84_015547 [Mauremys mutica]
MYSLGINNMKYTPMPLTQAVLNQGKWAFLLKYQLEFSKCSPEMKPQNISELHSQRNTVTLASRSHKMHFPYYKTLNFGTRLAKRWHESFHSKATYFISLL